MYKIITFKAFTIDMIIKLTKQHKSIHTIIIPWSKIYKLLETERYIPTIFYVYHCDSNIQGLASLLLWCDTIKMICYYSPPGEIVYSMWQMINDGRVGPTGIRYNHKNNVQSKLLIVFIQYPLSWRNLHHKAIHPSSKTFSDETISINLAS